MLNQSFHVVFVIMSALNCVCFVNRVMFGFTICVKSITSRQFKCLSDNCFAYMCRQCTFNNGTYDFHASLKRLKGRASSGKLKDAGVIEEIFLRNVKIPQKLCNVKLVPCLSS